MNTSGTISSVPAASLCSPYQHISKHFKTRVFITKSSPLEFWDKSPQSTKKSISTLSERKECG